MFAGILVKYFWCTVNPYVKPIRSIFAMKKISCLLVAILCSAIIYAQDTIYKEDFNNHLFHTYYLSFPSGADYDTAGYDIDADDLNDGSNLNPARPDAWFLAYPFADADSLAYDGDTNFVFAANSWFEPRAQALNYLITPSIYLADNTAELHWKSAPYQTPYYCDGYKVLVSTGTNLEDQFTDTLFVAGEYLSTKSPMPDSTWNGYNFSETGFIHGLDGTYVDFKGDSARFRGVLRPFSVSLAQYAGKKIFIAFLHDTDDDNLLSIDDIVVTGNGTVEVKEAPAKANVAIFPNPTKGNSILQFDVIKPGAVSVEVYDLMGRLVEKRYLGNFLNGNHNYNLSISDYSSGTYYIKLNTATYSQILKLAVQW